MPEKKTLENAKRDLRQGKSPSTAAGEFVKEEIEHVRQGKHGARSTKQAIAIGLSKARRALARAQTWQNVTVYAPLGTAGPGDRSGPAYAASALSQA